MVSACRMQPSPTAPPPMPSAFRGGGPAEPARERARTLPSSGDGEKSRTGDKGSFISETMNNEKEENGERGGQKEGESQRGATFALRSTCSFL